MKESEINMNSLVGHLRPRYRGYEDVTIEQLIENYVKKNPKATAHQIFNALVAGKGTAKSHLSGLKEGDIKPASRWPKLKKSAKRNHNY